MTPVLASQHFRKLRRVREVAVVREANAVRRVHIERLRLSRSAVAPRRGIAHVTDSDVALEIEHVMLLEHVPHEPAAFARVELAFARSGDARGILATMLQHRHRIVEPVVDRTGANDSDEAAHGSAHAFTTTG